MSSPRSSRKTPSPCLGVLALAMVLSQAARGEVTVVADAASQIPSLSKGQVADIYLGRAAPLPGANGVIPVDLNQPAELRAEFYLKVTGKTAAQVRAYWARMSFTGRGTPPREAANLAELKKLLAANPRMLGYVERPAQDADLKVLYVAH